MNGHLAQAALAFGLACYAVIVPLALCSGRWRSWARRHRAVDYCAALLLLAVFVRLCETAFAHRGTAGYVGLGAGVAAAALVLVTVRVRRSETHSAHAG